ncbi:hypothetical protein TNCV_5020281 [Trichonephila clavipes]|nr:hypothetical protein TNCV_5020281 [Trichonephila clavipes]
MMEKITPNIIDEILSAEVPDIEIDKDLHDIVSKNMIHGSCGSLNNNSPCMSDGKMVFSKSGIVETYLLKLLQVMMDIHSIDDDLPKMVENPLN